MRYLFLVLLLASCDSQSPVEQGMSDAEVQRLTEIHRDYVRALLGDEVIIDDWSNAQYCPKERQDTNLPWEISRPCGGFCTGSVHECTREWDGGIIEFDGKLRRWLEYEVPSAPSDGLISQGY